MINPPNSTNPTPRYGICQFAVRCQPKTPAKIPNKPITNPQTARWIEGSCCDVGSVMDFPFKAVLHPSNCAEVTENSLGVLFNKFRLCAVASLVVIFAVIVRFPRNHFS